MENKFSRIVRMANIQSGIIMNLPVSEWAAGEKTGCLLWILDAIGEDHCRSKFETIWHQFLDLLLLIGTPIMFQYSDTYGFRGNIQLVPSKRSSWHAYWELQRLKDILLNTKTAARS